MARILTIGSVLVSAAIFGGVAFAMTQADPTISGIATVVGGVIGYIEAKILNNILARQAGQSKGRNHE